MLNNEKIGKSGFKVFVILTFIGTSVLNIPGTLVGKAKQDAWIASIVGVIVSLFIIGFYNIVAQRMVNITLVQYSHKVLGEKLGRIISVWLVLFFIFNSASVLYIVGTFITTNIMVETPSIVVNLLFMSVVIVGCRLGIEVIVRSAEVLFPWVISGYVILIFFLLPQLELKKLRPLFEVGLKPIFHGALLFEAFVPLTFIAFLMIFPVSTNNFEEEKQSFYTAVLIGGILIIIQTIATTAILGIESASRHFYPSYTLAKKVAIGHSFERVEAIIAMVWIVSIFYKTSLYFYASVVGTAQIFNLKDYKCLTLPLGIIVVVLSQVIYPTVNYEMNWDSTTWVPYVLTNAILIPLLLLVIGKFKERRKQ